MTSRALGEFDLIERYFARPVRRAVLGVGDDCALLRPAPDCDLAVSTDTLVEGRHFLADVDPVRLGHKALAVNLSDLAACGAVPLAFTLALTLPRAAADWLEGFAAGLFALADDAGIELVGGDTTGGPLAIGITVFGEVPRGKALLRRGAHPGDELWVSGTLGDARLALEALRGQASLDAGTLARVREALERPLPRLALGQALRGVAAAAIDLSDGLTGDLGHLLARSAVGACIDADALPRSQDLAAQPLAVQRLCTLAGGDDYELLIAAPPSARDAVAMAARQAGVAMTRIGVVDAAPGLRVHDAQARPVPAPPSWDHFAGVG